MSRTRTVASVETEHSQSEAPWQVPRQASWLSGLKWVFVVSSSLFSALLLLSLFKALAAQTWAQTWTWTTLLVVPSLVFGYLMADMLSGTAHWFCDTFFEEDTPIIGKLLIQPFRDHHVYPQRITRYRFIEQDTSNFFLMLPLLATTLKNGAPAAGHVLSLCWSGVLLGLCCGSFFTNLFHKWAHQASPPRFARWLQRAGLILSPQRHGQHHSDYERGFCVTSGWMNPLLDSLRFFPRLERAIRSMQR